MAATPLLFPDATAVARAAAQTFLDLSLAATAAHHTFRVALSGGSTPKRLYSVLAEEPFRSRMPWSKIHFFVSDERNVPPDHPESNFGAAKHGLFSKVSVPAANIHRVLTERPPVEAAALYQNAIAASFGGNPEQPPCFDLIFLGMGADGHTASLFPETSALAESERWVASNWVEKLQCHRFTFTYPLINRAAHVLILVTGEDKAERIASIFGPDAQPGVYPVQHVRPVEGTLNWYLDKVAAARTPGLSSAKPAEPAAAAS